MDAFHERVRREYIARLKAKDRKHFGTKDNRRGPLESLFRQMDFQPLVFGTFAEMSSNAKVFIAVAVEYGEGNLGRSISATTLDYVRETLMRRYMSLLSISTWRGYANLVLDMTKYVGTGQSGTNRA